MLSKIITEHAPQAIGPYSQAVFDGRYVFVSGQLPLNPKTSRIESSNIEEQTECVLQHLSSILQAANSSFDLVLRVDIFLKNIDDFSVVNTIYERYFKGPYYPARQTVEVSRLPREALIEISCIALVQN